MRVGHLHPPRCAFHCEHSVNPRRGRQTEAPPQERASSAWGWDSASLRQQIVCQQGGWRWRLCPHRAGPESPALDAATLACPAGQPATIARTPPLSDLPPAAHRGAEIAFSTSLDTSICSWNPRERACPQPRERWHIRQVPPLLRVANVNEEAEPQFLFAMLTAR